MNREIAAANGECLKEEVLTDYLEGTLDPVVKSACEVHLIACDPCRQNLALFMRVLREDGTPEEEATLQQLSAIWEQRNLQPVPAKPRWRISSRHVFYPALAMAAVLLLAVGLGWRPFNTVLSDPARITQKMASTMRPFEPRIVGQSYREVEEVTRSVDDNVPSALTSVMTEKSVESYVVGRYFLLIKDYARAVKYLKTAVADPKGVPADVHNDLGVAYMESGLDHLGAAEAEFKDALNRDPDHKPAIFNLIILYERSGRLDAAIQRRQQYLGLDPNSGWAKEVEKKRLRKEPSEK